MPLARKPEKDLDLVMEGLNEIIDVTCQGTVPRALRAFLESAGYEDAIRNAVSLGGDADTMACITGGVAEAFFGGVPVDIAAGAVSQNNNRVRQQPGAKRIAPVWDLQSLQSSPIRAQIGRLME